MTGGIMSEQRFLERNGWSSMVKQYFANAARDWPDLYNFLGILTKTPEIYVELMRKFAELDDLEAAKQDELPRVVCQISGLFQQAHFRGTQGFTAEELALDENGEVIALLITPAHITEAGASLKGLGEFWVALDPLFPSPDGQLVMDLEDFLVLIKATEAEGTAYWFQKLQ
jgi:hypothetical protein